MRFGNRFLKSSAFLVLFSFTFLVLMGQPGPGKSSVSRGRADTAAVSGDEERPGSIEQQAPARKAQVSKRKFPWLLVLFGVAVAAVAIYFFVVKKTKYTLTVTIGQGAQGAPAAGSYQYQKGEVVDYSYAAQAGFIVSVKLDGQAVGASGTVTMNAGHTLDVQASQIPQNAERVVVAEKFTGTWCQYCPGAAMGLEELKNEVKERLVVISYHGGDSFTVNAVYNARKNLYGVSGVPDVYFDGVQRQLGGSATVSMYSYYKPLYDIRAAVAAQANILLAAAGSNAVNVTVTNLTSGTLTGTLHVAIIENNIAFAWQNQTKLEFVCRAMLPSESGEKITLSAGQTLVKSRTFTVAAGWNRANCRVVAFLQGDNKEIYQGAEIGL